MPYNPTIHHRHSIRLRGYDYSQAGLYFVTICVQNRECLLGEIANGGMILNKYGKIVDNEWQNLTNKYPHINLYEYAIMPNHFHGIVQITDVAVDAPLAPVGAGFARHDFARPDIIQRDNTRNDNDTTNHETGLEIPDANIVNRASGRANPAPTNANGVTLGNIIAYFKYQTTKKIDLPYKLWQRNYYEHIIRNKQSHKTISDYIITNPAKWRDDKLFIE